MHDVYGYPTTPHIEGSGLQDGDDRSTVVPASVLRQGSWIVEEKVDAANSSVGFNAAWEPILQSRGSLLSLLRDVWIERHFNPMKTWLSINQEMLLDRLEDRYRVFGECMSALHSVYYDHLPHHFMEFDVFDRRKGIFLSTPARRELLQGLGICAVPVLSRGILSGMPELLSNLGPSLFRTPAWDDSLQHSCRLASDDYARRSARLYKGSTAEGLYVKQEDGERVLSRMKWVQPGFVQTILDAHVHWQSAFIVPNLLGRWLPEFPASSVRPGVEWHTAVPDYDPDAPAAWFEAGMGHAPVAAVTASAWTR